MLSELPSIADIVERRRRSRSIWDMGFDAVVWVWRYFLLGAVIVVPIWLLLRLARSGRN